MNPAEEEHPPAGKPPDVGDDGPDDALAERLAAIDDRLVGAPAPPGDEVAPVDDDDALLLADHLDVILRLREAGERSRGPSAEGAGEDAGGLSIGPFRVLHELGRGGFAVVYEAFDPRLGRHVALKVIRPETPHLPGLKPRFLHDARFAARLNHPDVVTVYEAGESDGFTYIAQELCTGGSLADWLAAHPGPVDPRLAAEIVANLASAVDAAHRLNILHRDITPSNVLLAADPLGPVTSDGIRHRTKLADFGLAKLLADDGESPRLTHSDANPGTPAWMAPEQIDPEVFGPVGPATDIHALGLLLDRLLTGIPPHGGRSTTEIYREILLSEPRPADAIVRDLPRDLVAVAFKARAKRPTHRYASSADLAADLGRFLAGTPTIARPRSLVARLWQGGRHLAAGLPLAAALAMAVIASMIVVRQHFRALQRDDEARLQEVAEAADRAFGLWRLGDVKQALAQADASPLAGSLPARWLRARTGGERQRLLDRAAPASPHPAERLDLYSIGLSADGWIGIGGADGTLFLFPPGADVPATPIHAHNEINDVVFSPDGRLVATVGEDGGVRLWRPEDGAAVGETGSGAGVFGVAFAPAGDRIAWGGRARTVEVQSLAADGVPVGPIVRHEPFAPWDGAESDRPNTEAVVFLDDGTLAAASGASIVVFDADDGTPLRTLDQREGSIGQIVLSPDGDGLLSIGTGRRPWLWNWRTGRRARLFQEHPNRLQGCTFSPDGRRIATGCRDGVIRVFDVDTGDLLGSLVGHSDRTWDIAWEEGGTILSSGADGTLRRWDPEARAEIAGFHETTLPTGAVTALVRLGAGDEWLLAGADSPAVVLRGADGSSREYPAIRFSDPRDLAASPDGRTVAVIDTLDPAVDDVAPGTVWGVKTMAFDGEGGARMTGSMPNAPPGCVAILDDGTVLVGSETRLLAWPPGAALPLERVRFSPVVDDIVASDSLPRRIAVAAGPTLSILPAHDDADPPSAAPRVLARQRDEFARYVVRAAWSADGGRLAYGIRDREVEVIDATTGAKIGRTLTIGGTPMAIAFSTDGRSLVVADRDCVRLCDARVGMTLDEVRPGWPITSIGLDDAPGRPGVLFVAGGHDKGRLLRLELGDH